MHYLWTEFQAQCDGCDDQPDPVAGNTEDGKRDLRQQGWTFSGPKCYCPECSTRRRQEAAKRAQATRVKRRGKGGRLSPAQRKMLRDAQMAEADAGGPRDVEVLREESRTAKSLVSRGLITLDRFGQEYRLTAKGRALLLSAQPKETP
jgi:hypothetical protein